MSQTPALDAEYRKVIPSKFVTKRDGTPQLCMTCGTELVMGQAFAATAGNGGWVAYCGRCAASTQAQIAGLVQRVEALVAPLGEAVPSDIVAMVTAAEADIATVLGTAPHSTSQFLRAKQQLLNIRTAIGNAKRDAGLTKAPVRTNNYSGRCATCRGYVDAGAGRIERINGRWTTFHLDGECPAPEAQTPDVADGLYLHADGTVRKLYQTRNERQGCKVLVPQSTGETNADGTPRIRGSFQYVPGGVRTVRDAVAAGTAHLMTQDEAAAFGRQYSFCCNCGLFLDDDRSLAAGYGPTCAKNHGWWYPTYTEAAEILGRPAGPDAPEVTEAQAPLFTAVDVTTCVYCDRPIMDHADGVYTDSKGEAICDGDDTPGPDFHHSPA